MWHQFIHQLHKSVSLRVFNPFVKIVLKINPNVYYRYGSGFGFLPEPFKYPNPVYGLLFYTIQLIIANVANNSLFLTKVYIFNAFLSNLGSLYLGYILAFILKNLCIVCVTIYAVNLIMILLAIRRYKLITSYKRYKKD